MDNNHYKNHYEWIMITTKESLLMDYNHYINHY